MSNLHSLSLVNNLHVSDEAVKHLTRDCLYSGRLYIFCLKWFDSEPEFSHEGLMKLKLQRQLCPFDATRDLERQDRIEVSGIIIKGISGLSLCNIRAAERVENVAMDILVKANTEDMEQATGKVTVDLFHRPSHPQQWRQ